MAWADACSDLGVETDKMSESNLGDPSDLVSIIVPTFNSRASLELLARSISGQTYSTIETIVVDKYSTDGTVQLAKEHGFAVEQSEGNRIAARSLGLRRAKGRYILFLDSDQVLDSQCVTELVRLSRLFEIRAATLLELSLGHSRWSELMRVQDRVEFYSSQGLPRWFDNSVIRRIDTTWMEDYDHVHGEDRFIRLSLERDGVRQFNCESAKVFHRDPDLSAFFLKQYSNTRHGTSGHLRVDYLRWTLPAVTNLLRFRRVRHESRSVSMALAYYWLTILKVAAQTLGVFASAMQY